MYTWAALKDNAKQAKILWTITEPCSNREFPREEVEKLTILLKILRISSWSSDMAGSCKELCGTMLRVGKQDDSTTLQSIYSMHR